MKQTAASPQATGPQTGFSVNMEWVFVALVAVVAVAAIAVSRKFPGTGLSTDIGSGRFPLIYSLALLVLCAILVVQHLLKRPVKHPAVPPAATAAAAAAAAAPQPASTTATEAETLRPDYKKTASGMAASVACLAAMPYTGYALTTAVYLAFLMWLLGMKHKLLNPVLALAITATIYFTFSGGLHVPLPLGSFFE